MLVKTLLVLTLVLRISHGNLLGDTYEELNSPKGFAGKLSEVLKRIGNGVSLKCQARLLQYRKSLQSREKWALKMFDASAKIPSGVANGNFVDLGFFDECLSVKGDTLLSKNISGQYCVGTVPVFNPQNYPMSSNVSIFNRFAPSPRIASLFTPPGFHFGMCFPDACSASDLQKVFKVIGLGVSFNEHFCQTEATQPKLGVGAIATLSFFGVILWLVLASTVYDAISQYYEKKPFHMMLIVFSAMTNGKKIVRLSRNKDQLSCLHGIRVISTMWVIAGHRYIIQTFFPIRNYIDLIHWMQSQKNMFIIGAPLVVDTFFLISGLVISYTHMVSHSKKVKSNIFMTYMHRYLRLTPVLAVMILVYVILAPHLGSGPLWPNMDYYVVSACELNWWKALLYIQNYASSDAMCIDQSWYLYVDMQLFLLSPLLLIPLTKWPKITLSLTGVLTFGSALTCFLIGWFYELNWNVVGNQSPEKVLQYTARYYYATETRAGPWLLGIILGYVMFKAKQKQIQLKKFTVIFLWAASLVILVVCVYGGHDLIFGEYKKTANSFHMALVRPSWTIVVGYIIFACDNGYGGGAEITRCNFSGPINKFLSLPIFEVLSKLTYSQYLVHYLIICAITAQIRAPPSFSNFNMMYAFWGDYMFVTFFAIILTLAFEIPVINIEKVLFGGQKKKAIERRKIEPQAGNTSATA